MKIRIAILPITNFLFIFNMSIAQTVEEKRSMLAELSDKYQQINAYKRNHSVLDISNNILLLGIFAA
jgi:hypothetical protein